MSINVQFSSFHCRSSVAVSPFCRCKIALFCKKLRKKNPLPYSRKQQKDTQRCYGNGNGETATEWWKPGINCAVHATCWLHNTELVQTLKAL